MTRWLLTGAAVLVLSLPTNGQTVPSAADLATRIQTRYATVKDFTADFTQSLTSALLTRPMTERGQLKVKKPDRMRWTYATDDKKVFVADGSRFYSYFPKDRYVLERKLPGPNESSTALLFLAGRANLARDFVPSLPAKQPDAEWRLMLAPKAGPADFKTIAVDVDRTSFALRGFTVTDEEGAVTAFRFTSLRENQGLPDTDFVFAIPRGVEVRRQ
jgi:outer membrane lipoprotein carrier protein